MATMMKLPIQDAFSLLGCSCGMILFWLVFGVASLPAAMILLLWALLMVYCVHELERVHTTTDKLANDISRPLSWPLQAIGCLIDLIPFQFCDLSDADALLQQGALDARLSVDDYSPLVVVAIHKLCDSLHANSVKLNWAGRMNLHYIITSGLTQYLLIHKYAKENPTITKTKLNRPLVVTGLPRSGTTHLHRLLSESTKNSMPIPLWQHFLPFIPPPLTFLLCGSKQLLHLYIQIKYYGWKVMANQYGMDSMHFLRPELPDECHISLRMAGASFLLWNLSPVFDYCEWLLDRDASGAHVKHAHETYKQCLQIMQSQNPDKRFVLKCPNHSYNLAILREVIPEAAVVVTHRDPCKTSLSHCSLTVRTQAVGCDDVDWRRSVQLNLRKDVKYSQALVAYCQGKGQSDGDIYHVSYKELVMEPVQLVQKISEALQIPVEDDVVGKMQMFLAKNQQHSKGIHRYSFEGLDLREEDVRRAFQDYKAFFDEYL